LFKELFTVSRTENVRPPFDVDLVFPESIVGLDGTTYMVIGDVVIGAEFPTTFLAIMDTVYG
jgi:hypothetical protein